MDRDEAIKLLSGGEQGVAEWNRWRREGKKIPSLGLLASSGAKGASVVVATPSAPVILR